MNGLLILFAHLSHRDDILYCYGMVSFIVRHLPSVKRMSVIRVHASVLIVDLTSQHSVLALLRILSIVNNFFFMQRQSTVYNIVYFFSRTETCCQNLSFF